MSVMAHANINKVRQTIANQFSVSEPLVGQGRAWEDLPMPRYFFNFVSADRVIMDSKGVELTGLEVAHWRAVKMAYYHLPDDDYCWTIEIKDTRGETLEIFVPSFANRKRLALR